MKKRTLVLLTTLVFAGTATGVCAEEVNLDEGYDTEIYVDDADDAEFYAEDGNGFGDELVVDEEDLQDIEERDVEEADQAEAGEEWKQAYLEAIQNLQVAYEDCGYALIYVDGDNIPELLCSTGVEAGGCQVYTWHNGVVDMLQTARLGYTYIDSENLFNNTGGHMGGYFDIIYTIENDMWVQVAQGTYFTDDTEGTEYIWEGQNVTEDEYNSMLNEVYDTSLAQSEDTYYSYAEICSVLRTGAAVSEGHRYEVVRKDVTWSQAQEECEQKGGYLATLTTWEEFDYVSDLIKQAGCERCSIWVGGSQKYSTREGYYWIDPSGEYSMTDANSLPLWLPGEPSYQGLTENGEQVEEDSAAMLYIKDEEQFCLNDAPDNILSAAPSYAGIIAYVCEYDK